MKSLPPKTESERRIRIAILERQMSVEQLAAAVGLKPGSTRNIIAGGTCSTSTRKRITNALGVQIWPDVPVSKREVAFHPGTEFEFSDIKSAEKWAKALGTCVSRNGKVIIFLKSVPLVIRSSDDSGVGVQGETIPATHEPALP